MHRKRGYDRELAASLILTAQEGDYSRVQELLEESDYSANMSVDGTTPLHAVCRCRWEGDLEVAKILVENGANLHAEDSDGMTPWHWAMQEHNLEMIKLFLKNGSDIDTKNKKGETILQWALLGSHFKLAAFLIENGANIKVQNKSGETPLHQTCESCEFELSKLLIENGADVDAKNKKGETPLLLACSDGCYVLPLVTLLVDNGADVDVQDKYGKTPLHNLCEWGGLEADGGVELLLEKSADTNLQNKYGQTPLFLACKNGEVAQAKLLMSFFADPNTQDYNGITPLHLSCEKSWYDESHSEIVKLLIENGANLLAEDNDGMTPLCRAWQHGDGDVWEIVMLFLENGSDIDTKTILKWALLNDHLEFAVFLIKNGANIKFQNKSGGTRLHQTCESLEFELRKKGEPLLLWAVTCSNGRYLLPLITVLLDMGVHVDAQDHDGKTPLHILCEIDHLEAVELLIENFANPNIENNYGKTPFFVACENGLLEQAKLLMEFGAYMNTQDNDGDTPLHASVRTCHSLETARLLIENAADPDLNVKNNAGETPLYLACEHEHLEEIVGLLLSRGAEL